MSTITIKRSWNYLGIARAYKVLLDKEEIGRVKNDSNKTFEVKPGSYTLQVGMDKFSGMSNVIDITMGEDEHLEFMTKMDLRMLWGFLCSVIGGLFFALGAAFNLPIFYFVALAVFGSGFWIMMKYQIKLVPVLA